jgi:hypothetical protein
MAFLWLIETSFRETLMRKGKKGILFYTISLTACIKNGILFKLFSISNSKILGQKSFPSFSLSLTPPSKKVKQKNWSSLFFSIQKKMKQKEGFIMVLVVVWSCLDVDNFWFDKGVVVRGFIGGSRLVFGLCSIGTTWFRSWFVLRIMLQG